MLLVVGATRWRGPASIPHLPDSMVAMLAGFDMGHSVIDTSEWARRFGVSLTSVDTFARRLAQA